jgi:hypothetical protein
MDNKIKLFEKNSRNIVVYVNGFSDLTVYTPYLTVKKKPSDASTLIAKTGLVSDPSSSYIFSLTPADTSLALGDYCYDITLENGTDRYTLLKDKFSILGTVKS